MSGRCAQCGGSFDHGKALARLIAEREKQAGAYIGNAREPFDFAEWLQGVRDGLSVERETRQGPLL